MGKNKEITVLKESVQVQKIQKEDYISLTDIARHKNAVATGLVISHWMSTRYTIEFMGLWEKMHNPNFNVTEFRNIRNESGSNGFILSSKNWLNSTGAIGIVAKSGRYGGTYAHKDIAFEFASWISAEFKLYLIRHKIKIKSSKSVRIIKYANCPFHNTLILYSKIDNMDQMGCLFMILCLKEFQRLKEDEVKQLGWDIRRNLTKINYRIHTDAIKENLIPPELSKQQVNLVYASEADILNMALFGKTAKQWRDENTDEKGNIRDYANVSQLVCLANLENLNAHLIQQNLPQAERLKLLNNTAIQQMRLLTQDNRIKKLEGEK